MITNTNKKKIKKIKIQIQIQIQIQNIHSIGREKDEGGRCSWGAVSGRRSERSVIRGGAQGRSIGQ